MSGVSKRLVGELGHLGVDDGVDPWPGEGHVHTADELLLWTAGEGIVDEPPQASWPATFCVIGEERFDDLDVAIGGHAVSSRKSPRLRQLSILRRWCLFFCRFIGDESNADFPVFAISCLVAKIKNTNRQTKPFRTIIERPIAAWFWQEVHESLNQIVDAPFIFRCGASRLSQNLRRLNLTPDIHEVCLF